MCKSRGDPALPVNRRQGSCNVTFYLRQSRHCEENKDERRETQWRQESRRRFSPSLPAWLQSRVNSDSHLGPTDHEISAAVDAENF